MREEIQGTERKRGKTEEEKIMAYVSFQGVDFGDPH